MRKAIPVLAHRPPAPCRVCLTPPTTTPPRVSSGTSPSVVQPHESQGSSLTSPQAAPLSGLRPSDSSPTPGPLRTPSKATLPHFVRVSRYRWGGVSGWVEKSATGTGRSSVWVLKDSWTVRVRYPRTDTCVDCVGLQDLGWCRQSLGKSTSDRFGVVRHTYFGWAEVSEVYVCSLL